MRWVDVSAGHTISWSIQPHKKSINFGLFKHPGAAAASPGSPTLGPPPPPAGAATSRNDKTLVLDKLSAIGLRQVHWVGKCAADKVSMGTWDVPEGEGGMYGLVFDNTFSKTLSKTATFVLMTYPTNAPPKSGHHMHYAQAMGRTSSTSLAARSSPVLGPAGDSSDSLPQSLLADRPKPSSATARPAPSSSFLTGVLHKKRRKRNQGYARRFFSLDFTSSTLSYYRNDHSSALRGAIPLSLAAIGANDHTREISVDSGAEVWQLRANNAKDFDMWRDALDRASRIAGTLASPTLHLPNTRFGNTSRLKNEAEENEWAKVETLVGRVAGTRDAVRRLAQDTDPKYFATPSTSGLDMGKLQDGLSPSAVEHDSSDYFPDDRGWDRKAFWKRKTSGSGSHSPSALFRRSVSAQTVVASPGAFPPVSPMPKHNGRPSATHQMQEGGLHGHCVALLRELDSVVEDFTELLAASRQRRAPAPRSATPSRPSLDSQESADEFFDATDGDMLKSQLLTIRRDSQEEQEQDDVSDGESASSSENEGGGSALVATAVAAR